ncbi:helix-turn-helix domain-containing protein [Nocardiopsis alkaliphila]|uniref:helix-turn-helix domain-containing protein n=1 Tax=Nocardiopsis alkaliphila TaxID=225762 RepID=UPI0003466080|nr:helix-turn-helix domain-containing protein [Nocardiopsis alkaliphila]
MAQQYYSVDQVAELLGLHVKTVRAYVREGRLAATRIGKQYRIHRKDLIAFTGGDPEEGASSGERPHAEASTVVQIDDVDRAMVDRLSTLLTSAVAGPPGNGVRTHVQVVHDPERARARIVLVGGLEETARLLEFVRSLLSELH